MEQAVEIAVVGMGCLFPHAPSVTDFWNNILNKKDSVVPVKSGEAFWNPVESYDPKPATPDKNYGRHAAYLPPIRFDPAAFGLPPASLESISQVQLLCLKVASDALSDAGLLKDDRPGVRRGVGVILAVSGSGETSTGLVTRLEVARWRQVLKTAGINEPLLSDLIARLRDLYPPLREESFAGYPGNSVAGRICSRFDLGGTHLTVDATCAGSLAALKVALRELRSGSCDAVLTGGATVDQSLPTHVSFSQEGVLSKTGCSRPYDAAADGIVLGDGIGMIVLKRLADARRDGHRVYAVIKAVGSSAEGKPTSEYAPSPAAQIACCRQAYQGLPFEPDSVTLIEGHGTGTLAGDKLELNSLKTVFADAAPGSIALGSVKSQIGHTRAAAGAAALIKTVLALYHRVLPPTIHVTQPNPGLNSGAGPFYINTGPRPWVGFGSPRRAAVNGFGFGGTNVHLVLEEPPPANSQNMAPSGPGRAKRPNHTRMTPVPRIVAIDAADKGALLLRCRRLLNDSAQQRTAFLSSENAAASPPAAHPRLTLVLDSERDLNDLLTMAMTELPLRTEAAWSLPEGLFYRRKALPGPLTAVFPGTGKVMPGLGERLALFYPEALHCLSLWDGLLVKQGHPPLTELLLPPAAFDAEETYYCGRRLERPLYTNLARTAFQAALFDVLRSVGFQPDRVLAGGTGLLVGLWAAGALPETGFSRLALALASHLEDASRPYPLSPQDWAKAVAATEFVDPRFPVWVTGHADALEDAAAVSAFLTRWSTAGSETRVLPPALNVDEAGACCLFTPPGEGSCDELKNLAEAGQVVFAHDRRLADERVARLMTAQLITGGYPLQTRDPYQAPPPAETSFSPVTVTLGGGRFLSEETRNRRRKALAPEVSQKAGAGPSPSADREAEIEKTTGGDHPTQRGAGLVTTNAGPQAAEDSRTFSSDSGPGPTPPPPSGASPPGDKADVEASTGMASAPPGSAVAHHWAAYMAELENQARIHELQAQFQQNQTQFLSMLNTSFERFGGMLENAATAAQQTAVAGWFHRSLELLAQNQAAYHRNYQEFLAGQLPSEGAPEPRIGQDSHHAGAGTAEFGPGLPGLIPAVKPAAPPLNPFFELDGPGAEGKPGEARGREAAIEPIPKTPPSASFPEPSAVGGAGVSQVPAFLDPGLLPDVDTITRRLLEAVSEKTGYPIEMLDLDMDMETDMGIDSIKRIEILGTMQESFGEMPLELENLQELRTLSQIIKLIETVLAGLKTTSSPGPATTVEKPRIAALEGTQPILAQGPGTSAGGIKKQGSAPKIERFAIHLKRLPPPDRIVDFLPAAGEWLLTDDGGGVAAALASLLIAAGQRVTFLRFPSLVIYNHPVERSPLGDVLLLDRSGEQALGRILEPWISGERELTGFVHLHPNITATVSLDAVFNDRDGELCESVFFAAKHLAESLISGARTAARFFAAVTRLDGRLGQKSSGPFPVLPASLHGLLKSLQLEWPRVCCKVVDAAPDLTPDQVAETILEALSTADRSLVELGRDTAGRWMQQALPVNPPAEASQLPDDQSLFVVSGGGRGIVAHGVLALAEAFACKFILLGRTTLPAEGTRATPAQQEVAATLAAVTAAGGTAIYRSADITDLPSLAAALADHPDGWPPVRGLIHGAGNISDKRIGEKTSADFRLVFDTKVLGLRNLLTLYPAGRLDFLLCYSSISGYLGNVGQADYAMANEVLAKFSAMCQGPRLVRTLHWGPWDGGMLKSELKQIYRNTTGLIRLDQGCEFLRAEFSRYGPEDRQVLISGMRSNPGYRFAKRLETVVFERRLSLEDHPFFKHVLLRGQPMLPPTFILHWLNQVAATLVPGLQLSRVGDFRVFKPIIVGDEASYRVVCRPVDVEKHRKRPAFELRLEASAEADPVCFARAVLSFQDEGFAANVQLNMPADHNLNLKEEALYPNDAALKLGRPLQCLKLFDTFDQQRFKARCRMVEPYPIASPALDSEAQKPIGHISPHKGCDGPGLFAAGNLNPFTAAAALQAAGCWFQHFQFRTAAFAHVETIDIGRPIAFDADYLVYGFIQSASKTTALLDLVLVDERGDVAMRFHNLSLRGICADERLDEEVSR